MSNKTARNEVTGITPEGGIIKTGKGAQDKYSEGWDKIFGKVDILCRSDAKSQEELIEEPSVMGAGHYDSRIDQVWCRWVDELTVCKTCHGEGGCFDAGWWYWCPTCQPEAFKENPPYNESNFMTSKSIDLPD